MTKTIMVSDRLPRPTHIMWNLISGKRLNTVNALKRIKEDEKAAEKKIVLKEVDSEHESVKKIRVLDKFNQRNRFSNSAKNSESEPNEGDDDLSINAKDVD